MTDVGSDMKQVYITNLRAFIVLSASLMLFGCTEENELLIQDGNVIPNSGVVSQKNFSVLTSDTDPNVLNLANDEFTPTEATITAYVGDRNNVLLTDPKTIFFEVDYGLIQPSCVTSNGSCSVTWTADKRPDLTVGGANGEATVTAYTIGEEGFTDANGNGIFDDGDGGSTAFDDLQEPFVDYNNNGAFNNGIDIVIDTVNPNDPTGANGLRDAADGLFNGGGCTHSTLCSTQTSTTVFARVRMNVTVLAYSVGGNINNLANGTTITLSLNGTPQEFTGDGSDPFAFTFTELVEDTGGYTVIVEDYPPGAPSDCPVTDGTGNISAANVGNVSITCM